MDEENQADLTNQDEGVDLNQEVEQIEAGEINEDQSIDQEIQDDDTEEIEFNSKAFRLPKEIAEAVKGMQKDYTVKTQTLAEQRREFEAQAQFQQENFKAIAQVTALNDQLAQFNDVDWNALIDADPATAQKLSLQREALRAKRDELHGTLAQKYQQETIQRQLEEAKLVESSESEIRRIIKDWSPELDNKLQNFAVDRYGFPKDYVKDYKKDPKVAKLLHDAYVGQQIIQKQMQKPKIIQDAKPVPSLSSKGATVSKNPAQMTAAQYRAWRKQGYK